MNNSQSCTAVFLIQTKQPSLITCTIFSQLHLVFHDTLIEIDVLRWCYFMACGGLLWRFNVWRSSFTSTETLKMSTVRFVKVKMLAEKFCFYVFSTNNIQVQKIHCVSSRQYLFNKKLHCCFIYKTNACIYMYCILHTRFNTLEQVHTAEFQKLKVNLFRQQTFYLQTIV